ADIALAVSEAVTNVIAHAHDQASPGAVILAAERDGDALRVLVRDHGVTRRAAALGAGLGLATIGQVAQSLEVRIDETGGAELRMKFQLAA
ncbi:MAG: ATP-binding protein, partial [Actinomycetota bacterium]|nr:ATP-binding protein [Actinomycetota bacterium]